MMSNTDVEVIHPVELAMADQYAVKSGHQKTELIAESDSMPAVLVDQQLIDEINQIPDRFGFKIGDVADLLGIKQYILRYWEQEFEVLKPKKASNNQRMYTRKDVENAFLIKKLLYRDLFSIEGARLALKDVKFALKKEKSLNTQVQKNDKKNENIQLQLAQIISEIRQLKQLFN